MSDRVYFDDDWDDPEIDEVEWSDGWCEAYQELVEAEDHAGVIKLCELRVERDPCDPHAWEALAYAHLNAGDPEKAIAVIGDKYQADPGDTLWQAVIGDALRAQGKPLEAFPWIRPPELVVLSSELLNWLQRFLKPKRKARTVTDLWIEVFARGYPFFGEEDLLARLRKDARFVVEEPELGPLTRVSVRRGA